MRTLTLLLVLTVGMRGQSVILKYMPIIDSLVVPQPEIESRWVETVERVGDTTCTHSFIVLSDNVGPGWHGDLFLSFYVRHDERGCPSDWGHERLLCEKCGRLVNRQELREFTRAYYDRLGREAAQRARIDSAKTKWGVK